MAPRKEEVDMPTEAIRRQREPETISPNVKSAAPIFSQQNGSIKMELGTYSALKLPMASLSVSFLAYPFVKHLDIPDPRMDGLPLMGTMLPVILICIFYVCFSIVWGPQYMANRPPMKLKKVLMVYNFVQVIICSYTFYQAGVLGWFWEYNYSCQQIDWSFDPKPMQITRICYIFFLTKILDLLDTVFFVLTKKWTHITLLHIFHHAGMVMGIYVGCKYSPGGHSTLLGFVNSFVHVLMYSYYFLSSMGPKVKPFLWWKKYITMIQLTQFVLVFLHAIQVFFIDCHINKYFQFFSCIYACVFFYLFIDFYMSSYRKQPSKKSVKTTMNGTREMNSNSVEKSTSNSHTD